MQQNKKIGPGSLRKGILQRMQWTLPLLGGHVLLTKSRTAKTFNISRLSPSYNLDWQFH